MRIAVAAAWAILPIAAGAGIYMLKMQVESQEQRLVSLQRQISDTREAIHVAKAEWSFLNEPERLRDQAQRLLGMTPIKPTQIVSFDRIPYLEAPAATPAPVATAPATPALPAAIPAVKKVPVAQIHKPTDELASAMAALAASNRRRQ